MFLDDIIYHPSVMLFATDILPHQKQYQTSPILCNTAFMNFCGFNANELHEKTIHVIQEIIHPDDIHQFVNAIKYLFKNKDKYYKAIYRIYCKERNNYIPIHFQSIIQHKHDDVYTLVTMVLPLDTQAPITHQCSSVQKSGLLHLTLREQDISGLLLQGKKNKEIAELLDISIETVKTHRKNIKRKLAADNSIHLLQILLSNHTT